MLAEGDLALLHRFKGAACTLKAGARLISSARIKLPKIGPFLTEYVPSPGLNTWVPVTSPGSMSGVNWMREKFASMQSARVRMTRM